MTFVVGPLPPLPEVITQARRSARMTKVASAQSIWLSKRQWYRYEDGECEMPVGLWELFLIKARLPYDVKESV